MKKKSKIILITSSILLIGLVVFFYIRFYFVFGVGVKTGDLNYIVNKGYIFKTYEGKMIQTGFRTEDKDGIHSNEFIFSVEDNGLAEKLMQLHEGREVTVRYKEYLGTLPWRGYSKFIVDSILYIGEKNNNKSEIPDLSN